MRRTTITPLIFIAIGLLKFSMHKRLKFAALLSLSIISFAAVTVSTVAWFSCYGTIHFGTDAGDVNVSGGSVASYYESGDGTEEKPYIISNRTHLYNLAWLQYLGEYNDSAINGEGIQQKYFKIKNNINLEGLTLPPIGTEKYPFLGNFDGNNKVISNFTISNDNPSEDESDFGVAKPANLYAGEPPEIVGFFGVVGELPSQDISYSSSIVSISNITLKDFTVKSETNTTLIGLAAGYVDGTMSGVKVDGSAKLDLGSSNKTAKTAITNNLTDYALVGYSTKTNSFGEYSQDISEWYDSNLSEYGGQDLPDFGGSVDVKALYERLEGIQSLSSDTHYATVQSETIDANGNSQGVSTSNITDSNVLHNYEDNDHYVGSFCFADDDSNAPTSFTNINLTGRRNVKRNVTHYDTAERTIYFNNTYYITTKLYNAGDFSKAYYLYPRNNYNDSVYINSTSTYGYTEPPTTAYSWRYTNASFSPTDSGDLGAVYSIDDNGNKWYLYVSSFEGSGIRAKQMMRESDPNSSETNYIWHVRKISDTNYVVNGVNYKRFYIYTIYNNHEYYLRTTGELKNETVSRENKEYYLIRTYSEPTVDTVGTDVYENYDTYLPLKTEDNSYTASITNTGYIVSGPDYTPEPSMRGSGTIEVSWFSRSGQTFEFDADTAKNTIRTIHGGTADDDLAQSIEAYDDFDSNYSKLSPLLDSSSTGNKFYALRFNESNSLISKNDCVTIPKGKLNNQTFTNYDFPRNSISFSLVSKGKASFFAGTFVGNSGTFTSFFSIHKINRSGGSISSIEEILKVYVNKGNPNLPCIYETSASSPSIPDGYELAFDTEWITNPDSITIDKIYYFEIPLNAGDYAMGAVHGKKGARLMYFDIGTNGNSAVDSVTGYYVTTHKSSYSYPSGVDFKVVNVGNDGGDSMCVVITSSNQGYVQFGVTETLITITGNVKQGSTPLSTYSYQGTKFSNSAASGKFTVDGNSPGDLPPLQANSERKVFATVRLASGSVYSIVVTDVLGSDSSIVSSTFVCNGTSYNSLADLTSAVGAFTNTVLSSLRGLDRAVTLTRTGDSTLEFNATPTYSIENRKDVIIELDVTGVSVLVSNIDDYTIYKNSIAQANRMTNGNTYNF